MVDVLHEGLLTLVHLKRDTLDTDAPAAEIPVSYLHQTTCDLLGLFAKCLMTFFPSM